MLSEMMIEFEFDSIELTFFVPGHSQNENDTAHSVIERYTRNLTIYIPAQWDVLIPQAFQSNECAMTVLTYKDIIDFKYPEFYPSYRSVLADKCYPSNDDTKKWKKVMWASIVQVLFSSKNKDKIFYKYDYHQDYNEAIFRDDIEVTWRKRKICNSKEGRQRYSEPWGIASQKKKDVLK